MSQRGKPGAERHNRVSDRNSALITDTHRLPFLSDQQSKHTHRLKLCLSPDKQQIPNIWTGQTRLPQQTLHNVSDFHSLTAAWLSWHQLVPIIHQSFLFYWFWMKQNVSNQIAQRSAGRSCSSSSWILQSEHKVLSESSVMTIKAEREEQGRVRRFSTVSVLPAADSTLYCHWS